MFSNKMIAGILIPVVLEQLLNSIMGTADTMMVSNVGSAAISAVSLVDSINILVIQAFYALAAGGTIILPKQAGGGVTFALALRPFAPDWRWQDA